MEKEEEIPFKIRPFLVKGFDFYADKFVILKTLEEIPYSMIEDIDSVYLQDIGSTVWKIKISLKGTPKREIEIPYVPRNKKLGLDLFTWLNIKVGEMD